MEKIHLSAETMARLLSDALSTEESLGGEAHLRVCPECRGKLDELTTTAPALAALLSPAESLPATLCSAPPDFELLGVLGVGKTAAVYRARQPRLGRLVALKVLSGGWPTAAEARLRFQAEIEAVASQNHPHIVQVFEVGTHEERPFLVMEYCGGGNLAERLRDGPLPPREAAGLIELLARTLHSVHGNGLVHRDLKPANILFDGEGRPKVADFGVVKRLDSAAAPTPVGSLLGTPPYLAPEQIDGSAPTSSLCDVYALGAILYECLIGRPPFRAESIADTLFDVLSREPMPPRLADPRLPRDLETICLKCLEKEPIRRYGAALELAEDLHRFLIGQAVRARPVRLLGRSWRWLRRNPLPAALAAALLVALVTGLGICGQFWYQAVASRGETESARRESEENFLRTRRLLPELVTATSSPARQVAERKRLRRSTLERACGLYRELCRVRPDDRELRGELAHVLTSLAEAATKEWDYDSASAAAEEALAYWRQLRDEDPGEPRWRRGRARALVQLAMARRFLGHPRQTADAYREAVAICQALADEYPGDEGLLLETVAARSALEFELRYSLRIDQSQSLSEENRKQLEAALTSRGVSVGVRLALVQTLYALGVHQRTRGDIPAAIDCWRAGCKHGADLEISFPLDARAWFYPTACAMELPCGDAASLTTAQAIPRLEKAVQLREIDNALDPEATGAELAEMARRLADCYLATDRPADSLRIERRAAEALLPHFVKVPIQELLYARGTAYVARRDSQTGHAEAAKRHAREAAESFERFSRTHAEDAVLLEAAIDSVQEIAPALRHAGTLDQSRRVIECALQIVQKGSGENADATQLWQMSELWTQLAKCRMQDDRDGVEAALRDAVDTARRLVALRPENRYLLDNRLDRLARWLAELGRGAQAAACLHECERLWATDADGLRGVARHFRELAGEVKKTRATLSREEEAEREEYLDEAARLEKAATTLTKELSTHREREDKKTGGSSTGGNFLRNTEGNGA